MQDKPSSVPHGTSKPGIYFRIGGDGKRRYRGPTWLEPQTGSRRWKTVAGNLDAAERELHDTCSRINRGERIGPSRVRFREYSEAWIDSQRESRPKTITTYETHLRVHVYPRLGRMMLTEIGEDEIAALISEMLEGSVCRRRATAGSGSKDGSAGTRPGRSEGCCRP